MTYSKDKIAIIALCIALAALTISGPQGSQGPQGEPGINGSQGPQGPQGEPGINGTNGTNATANSGYYRVFFPLQGVVGNGTWSWSNDPAQTDTASVRIETDTKGVWTNSNTNLSEYIWKDVYLATGKYNITMISRKYLTFGIVNFSLNGTHLGFIDLYDGSGSVIHDVLSTVTINIITPLNGNFSFKVTSKNTSSPGHNIEFSRLWISKIGEI